MIGVAVEGPSAWVTAELFEIFKTPWTVWGTESRCPAVLTYGPLSTGEGTRLVIRMRRSGQVAHPEGSMVRAAGVELPLYLDHASTLAEVGEVDGVRTVDLGYDLLGEVAHVLAAGQPAAMASYPAVDLHVAVLRAVLGDAGVPIMEIPPSPLGTVASVCLTHDVDFFDPRDHVFDHTLLGFLARASVGSTIDAIRGRVPWRKAAANYAAAARLPLVLAGMLPNPWDRFDEYVGIEEAFGSTFFLVPEPGNPGRAVSLPAPERRAVSYRLEAVAPHLRRLAGPAVEFGLHGIDAWIDTESAVRESDRVSAAAGVPVVGTRMHWLLYAPGSPQVLEAAGLAYDSTRGYNETVGFQAGTSVPFRPPGTRRLLELPLLVQDTALLSPSHLHLGDEAAWDLFLKVLQSVVDAGGVFTSLWHMRSLAPERLWGDFYRALVTHLGAMNVWRAPARDVVGWFEGRRGVTFEPIEASGDEMRVGIGGVPTSGPPLALRLSGSQGRTEELPVRAGPVAVSGVRR